MAQERIPRPGRLHRLALTSFAALPRRLRVLTVHLIAPTHTVGALCLLEHDGRLLMLQQHHRQGWTLPGGLVDRGEGIEEAAVREVREETGLQVEVGLPVTALVDPGSRRVDVLFHVPVAAPVPVTPRNEAVRAAWLLPEEAGVVDDATAQVFAVLARLRLEGSQTGRLL